MSTEQESEETLNCSALDPTECVKLLMGEASCVQGNTYALYWEMS